MSLGRRRRRLIRGSIKAKIIISLHNTTTTNNNNNNNNEHGLDNRGRVCVQQRFFKIKNQSVCVCVCVYVCMFDHRGIVSLKTGQERCLR